jgi:hypothetical protein
MADTTTDTAPKYLDPVEARRKRFMQVTLADGSVIDCRRLDMTAMLFEGLMPMPILNAAQKLISKKGGTSLEKFGELEETDKREVKEMLQRHACAVAIRPVVVEEEDGDPTHMPVTLFDFMDLMTIFNETAVSPTSVVAPATARRFRSRPVRHAADAVPDGQNVQPPAEPVDLDGSSEFISE